MAGAISVAGRDGSNVDGTTFNFTVTAGSDGHLLCGFTWYGGDSAEATVASVNIDGGSATVHLSYHPAAQRHALVIAGRDVSAGSISVQINLDASTSWMICESALATGINTTAYDTGTAVDNNFPTTGNVTLDVSLDTVTDGVVFGITGSSVVTAASANDLSWSAGLTDFGDAGEISGEATYALGGYDNVSSGEAPRTVTAFYDGNGQQIYGAVAGAVSFQPAVAAATPRVYGTIIG